MLNTLEPLHRAFSLGSKTLAPATRESVKEGKALGREVGGGWWIPAILAF
jgi:hypothetical protein